MTSCPPWLVFYFGALLAALVPAGVTRKAVMLLTPVISFALFIFGGPADATPVFTLEFPGSGLVLEPYTVGPLAWIFIAAFHLAALLGVVYSLHVRDQVQHSAALCYAGSSLGVVCSGDLLTVFFFWEVMAVSSVFLIWARRTEAARRAGFRYLVMQLTSGLLLFAGALLLYHDGGSLSLGPVDRDHPAFWVLLVGIGIKAAFPGLHTWLTDAYPEATPTGTVWLSAFTTKTAIYLLAVMFAGNQELIVIGAVMAAFPIFYAVIENDLRRVLAYSLINQVGFMVVGIGIGSYLSINGSLAHAFNDILFKGLLFMSMGAVLHRTGKIGGSELGGIYRTMPLTCLFCIIGAASISAFPLFSGFVSKSMVMSAAADEGIVWLWLVLLFASAGVFHHAGIKIPFFAFFAHDSKMRPKEAPWNMLLAMAVSAGLCIFIGCFPERLTYAFLPVSTGYSAYDTTHVLTQLQILFWSALAFTLLMLAKLYPPELPSVNLDFDWFLRRGAALVMVIVRGPVVGLFALGARLTDEWLPSIFERALAPIARPRETAEVEERSQRHRRTGRVGFEPKETTVRKHFERLPSGAALTVATAALALLLILARLFV